MSAICGVVGLDGRQWNVGEIEGMVRALAPLGRDGGGRWNGPAGRCSVAIAATLRHSTPEDVSDYQPAKNRNGSLILVGDLRIDNRDELAASLDVQDKPSVPDSAFALAAYERWRLDVPERLVGDFAFAIVDRPRGGVLLVRDHLGIRPLVVHERPGVVGFASTALALTHLEGVGHRLDIRRAIDMLALAYGSERTFVEGVRWLPPGNALWITDSGVRRWRWWRPDPHGIVDLGSSAAHEQELREAFDRAVAARLRAVGAVGAAVSGGLDSTSSAATAAQRIVPKQLPTYTSVPPSRWPGGELPGWDADESELVLKLVQLYPNLAPRFVCVERDASLFGLHEPLWRLGAGPARNPCNFLWWYAIRTHAAQDGIATLLSGARGNLHFSADGPDWLAALLRHGRVASAAQEAVAWSRASDTRLFSTIRDRLVYPLLPAGPRRFARALTGRTEPIEEWAAAIALRREIVADLELAQLPPFLRVGEDTRLRSLLATEAEAGQAEMELALTAHTGVEDRDPTSDRRVLEVAMRQPEWVRRHDGVTRAVARGAMSDRLPPEIVHRTRRGEQLPDWLDLMTTARAELQSELEALEQHPTSQELIDTPRLRRLFESWPDRTRRTDPTIIRDYRLAFLRALLVSKYLRWFERRATETGPSRSAA